MPSRFFDSNVLLYLAAADPAKSDRTEALLVEGGSISVQVLNEVANVARRKMRLSWPQTRQFIGLLRGVVAVHGMTIDTHETGLALAERHGLSIWDAMIVAAALEADCDTLWSEDMQDGMVFEGRLRVVNPFRAEG